MALTTVDGSEMFRDPLAASYIDEPRGGHMRRLLQTALFT